MRVALIFIGFAVLQIIQGFVLKDKSHNDDLVMDILGMIANHIDDAATEHSLVDGYKQESKKGVSTEFLRSLLEYAGPSRTSAFHGKREMDENSNKLDGPSRTSAFHGKKSVGNSVDENHKKSYGQKSLDDSILKADKNLLSRTSDHKEIKSSVAKELKRTESLTTDDVISELRELLGPSRTTAFHGKKSLSDIYMELRGPSKTSAFHGKKDSNENDNKLDGPSRTSAFHGKKDSNENDNKLDGPSKTSAFHGKKSVGNSVDENHNSSREVEMRKKLVDFLQALDDILVYEDRN